MLYHYYEWFFFVDEYFRNLTERGVSHTESVVIMYLALLV